MREGFGRIGWNVFAHNCTSAVVEGDFWSDRVFDPKWSVQVMGVFELNEKLKWDYRIYSPFSLGLSTLGLKPLGPNNCWLHTSYYTFIPPSWLTSQSSDNVGHVALAQCQFRNFTPHSHVTPPASIIFLLFSNFLFCFLISF